MKKTRKVILVLLAIFILIQFFPTKRNQSDEILATDFTKTFEVPMSIQKMLKKSCYDCHSNNTIYPWYNKVQPVSWLLERHINEAKGELNFSEFGGYSKRRQKAKLKSIVSQIKDNVMPLNTYTLMHRDAIFSKKQKQEIMEWMEELRDNL